MVNNLQMANVEVFYINLRICVLFFISAALFALALKIYNKPTTKDKRKEHKDVISPILAEVLVDGKIDIKNLILATIVELQIKGNIAIMNDNVIELLNKNNLNSHEIQLVDMIFLDKKLITINEINDRFVYNQFTKVNFVESMSRISEEIQTKLYELKVFSKRKMLVLNLISYISLLILVNLPAIIVNASFTQYTGYLLLTVIINIVATCRFFSRLIVNNEVLNVFRLEFGSLSQNATFTVLFIITSLMLITMLPLIKISLISIIAIFITFIVNLMTLRMTKNNVLSEKGLEERKKVLELKNFLEDYEFRKYENGESYIVWDEYFAYAAALGVSNPVILDVYKKWHRLNIKLAFTNNLI